MHCLQNMECKLYKAMRDKFQKNKKGKVSKILIKN